MRTLRKLGQGRYVLGSGVAGLLVLLAAAPLQAAGPPPAGNPGHPAAAPAAAYSLQGNTTNTGNTYTTFTTNSGWTGGGWKFSDTYTNARVLKVTCTNGPSCVGIESRGTLVGTTGSASSNYGVGVEGEASGDYGYGVIGSGRGDNSIGVYGEGYRYGGYFFAFDSVSGPLNVGVKGVGRGTGGEFSGLTSNSSSIGVKGTGVGTGGVFTATGSLDSIGVKGTGGGSGGEFSGRYGVKGTGSDYGGYFVAPDSNPSGVGSTSSGPYMGVVASSSTAGSTAVYAMASGDGSRGVSGMATGSNGTGVLGTTGGGIDSIGVYGVSGDGKGVYGASTTSTGVYGTSTGTAGIGVSGFSASYYGVQGKSTTSVGVRGISTSLYGVYASSTDGTGLYTQTTNGPAALRAKNANPGNGNYAIIADGNVQINGNYVATGTKSARVATTQGDRLLYAEEATQNRFADEGTAQLVNGRAVITIDPLYAQTVTLKAGYQVYVTPNSAETLGLAVINETATGFEVRELGKGTGSFGFHWRISALRKGYEKDRLAPAPAVPAAPPDDGK